MAYEGEIGPMKVKLLLLSTAVKPNEFNVILPAKIGRGKEASLRLVHSQISRLHCELFEQDGQLLVRDLASLNGTFVDEQRVDEPCALISGCKLKVGSVEFQVQIGDAVAQIVPPERSGAATRDAGSEAAAEKSPAADEQAKPGSAAAEAATAEVRQAEEFAAIEAQGESDEMDVAWLFEDDEPKTPQKAGVTPTADATIQAAPAADKPAAPAANKPLAAPAAKPTVPAKKPLPVAKAEPVENPVSADSEATTMWKPVPATPAKQPPAPQPAEPAAAKPSAAPKPAGPRAPAKPSATKPAPAEPQFEVGPEPGGEEPDPDLDEFFKSIM